MDSFFAQVELRENPSLAGAPLLQPRGQA